MEKLEHYQNMIIEVLKEHDMAKPENLPESESQLIFDKENNHYLLYRIGWKGSERIHYCVFHIDIINEKIWVQEDNTDTIIVDDFLERGVPKSDIVLGFKSPDARPHTEFAVA
ncbi:MAG: XisI protein [Spirochaetota bacterium]